MVTHYIKPLRLGSDRMIPFALGALVGAGCVAIGSELYTRWLYADVKRRAKQQGISDRQMKDALVWAAKENIEESLIGK
jgi:hypothetical protein